MTDIATVQILADRVVHNVEHVIVGKHREVQLVVLALLCRGHVLIEDIPGVGKTVVAKAIARSLGCTFKRIQFTPDLLPGDVTGVSVFNQLTQQFEYRPGPIVSQLVLADEINRATPKTQSALLEAMEESQVTVDGVTHPLPNPFIVLATENPIEYQGTFPLPEAQLDRFLVRIALGYPGRENELQMLERQHDQHPLERIGQVVDTDELLAAQRVVRTVRVAPAVAAYAVAIVDATRRHESVQLGASPRGSLALYNTARTWAAMQGRLWVEPDDIKDLADAALAHRVILHPGARLRGVTSSSVIRDILATVPVPGAMTTGRSRNGTG